MEDVGDIWDGNPEDADPAESSALALADAVQSEGYSREMKQRKSLALLLLPMITADFLGSSHTHNDQGCSMSL